MKTIGILCLASMLAMQGFAPTVKSAAVSQHVVTGEGLPLTLPEPGAKNVSGALAQLFGRRWWLAEVEGTALRVSKPYIEFDREAGRFAGDGGCNRISGSFELNGTNLKFSRVISTRRACLDVETQRVETNFLRALEQVTGLQIQDDILRLYARGSAILTFRAETSGAPSEARVTGTVAYLQRIALPPDAVVRVRLLEVARGNARAVIIAEEVIRPAGRQVPIPFELRYDPRRIKERRRYTVQARINVGGRLRFINTDAYPVITGGHTVTVNVIVRPVRR